MLKHNNGLKSNDISHLSLCCQPHWEQLRVGFQPPTFQATVTQLYLFSYSCQILNTTWLDSATNKHTHAHSFKRCLHFFPPSGPQKRTAGLHSLTSWSLCLKEKCNEGVNHAEFCRWGVSASSLRTLAMLSMICCFWNQLFPQTLIARQTVVGQLVLLLCVCDIYVIILQEQFYKNVFEILLLGTSV